MEWFRERALNVTNMVVGAPPEMAPIQKTQHELTIPEFIPLESAGKTAYTGQQYLSPWEYSVWDGGKYAGGMTDTQIYYVDYWTLRSRSGQLFRENMYALGLLKRLLTNEINTGLTPELNPLESILGMKEGSLGDWTDLTEDRFSLWANDPKVCDWKQQSNFGQLQAQARLDSLIDGDTLVVLRFNSRTRLPQVQLISGNSILTPAMGDVEIPDDHKIIEGVELDAQRRHYAYWVLQEDGTVERIKAFGSRSGRRVAWLIYGSVKRLDDVRGTPLLTQVLQACKEIDRYKDAAQRQAWLASIIVAWKTREKQGVGTLPFSKGGAIGHSETILDQGDDSERKLIYNDFLPGLFVEDLDIGEDITFNGGQGTDVNYKPFEEAMVAGMAWGLEIPPEIATLAFSNNYSASQAALNEFIMYLNKIWSFFGSDLCTPVLVEWMISEVMNGKVSAPGFLDAWRDRTQYAEFGAWIAMEWYGSLKPTTDKVKQAKASEILVKNAWSTHSRESRINTGTKFDRNVRRLKRENEKLVDALRPMAEFNKEMGESTDSNSGNGNNPADSAEETALTILELVSEGINNGRKYG